MPILRRVLFVLGALALGASSSARAQLVPPERAALTTLRPAARARLAESAARLVPATVRRGTARVETAADGRVLVRADYRIRATPLALAATPEAAARAYLVANAARYGLAPDLADIRTARVVTGAYDHHVTFRQTAGGFDVFGREIKVSLSKALAPVMVVSGYAPGVRDRAVPPAALSAAAAAARVSADVLASEADVTAPERVVFADGVRGPRPAWRFVARTRPVAAEWEIVLDAVTGEALAVFERTVHASFGAADVPEATGFTAEPAFSLAPSAVRSGPRAAAFATDAVGLVFEPDPLTTAGVGYGGAFVDANDADVPELNAQRREVVLRDVGRENGKYVLKGPYVEIVGAGVGSAPYMPPAEDAPAFRYTRADDRFEAVMAYYHLDASQRRVQALVLGRPVHARPVRVNPQGRLDDNSDFSTGSGAITFGTGAVDDAEDAGILWHEYAHALMHDQEPGVYLSEEGRALHEGWADYWANSYTRGLLDAGRGAGDPKRLFPWDGNAGCWQGRRLDHGGRYDPPTVAGRPNMRYPARAGCAAMGTIYQWGVLWATTLAELRDALGADVADRLAVGSLAYLGPATSGAPAFEVAAEALLAADDALHGGSNRGVLVARLAARGYVDAGGYGPALAHAPLGSTEQAGGTRRVEVAATGETSPVARVAVVYRVGEGAAQTVALAREGERWAGEIPIPSGTGTIRYRVEATDEAGRTTRIPETDAYRFAFGPDTTAPALAHTPAGSLPRAAFPPEIVAEATDDLGIDAVTVAYRLVRAGGAAGPETVAAMRFENGAYRVRLPFAPGDVVEGDELRYTITARDGSAARNAAVLPASGAFALRVVGQGVLAAFDAERDAPGVTLAGAWRRGAPGYGLRTARAGAAAFSTGLAGAYPAERGVSHLTLPPLDLRSGPARLVFWQWHDTERAPATDPNACRSVCDGGRVEASVDGGASWRALAPEGGYPDTVDARFNGLPGGGVWGGYSYGWGRVAVPLPSGPSVRVRFAFGTDAGNVYPTPHAYAGWAVDSVVVTTAPFAPDAAAPVALALPDARVLRGANEPAQAVTVRLDDATGVRRAVLRYALVRAGAPVEADSVRMAQGVLDLAAFTALPVLRTAPRAGDVLRYTVRADDFAGNARTFPEAGAFEVAFRTLSEEAVAVARPNGLWHRLDDGAHAASGDGPGGDGPANAASSLVLVPLDLPANADALRLVVRHRYRFGAGAGGNAKLSADGGRTWTLLVPDAGYPSRLAAPGHPMHGEPVFAGADTAAAAFSLSAYAGQQVRVRFDVGAARPLAFGEAWTVEAATRYAATPDAGFETPRASGLALVYPNPFGARATVTYTLDVAASVTLEAYDALGRRVAILVGGARQEPGTYAATLDGAALAPGVYVLRLTAGGRAFTRTVVRG